MTPENLQRPIQQQWNPLSPPHSNDIEYSNSTLVTEMKLGGAHSCRFDGPPKHGRSDFEMASKLAGHSSDAILILHLSFSVLRQNLSESYSNGINNIYGRRPYLLAHRLASPCGPSTAGRAYLQTLVKPRGRAESIIRNGYRGSAREC